MQISFVIAQTALIFMSSVYALSSCRQQQAATTTKNTTTTMKKPTDKKEWVDHLTPQQYDVLVNKATDAPGNYGYTNLFENGSYHCRACDALLYTSDSKFHSGCGWPAFDKEVAGAVTRITDRSHGMVRTEILCNSCGGHLGHVFEGEGFTETNTRHCVNTSSLIFKPAKADSTAQ
jgi:peptide-methionine (R)-S-oxide reductase